MIIGDEKMGLLEVINVSHSFGDKILYKNVSFELFKGEHMGLVGNNGTGKTTLLNSIAGKIIPDKGFIRWQNKISFGYLDQHAKIDTSITIIEYLKTAFERLYCIEKELNDIYNNMSDNNNDEIMIKASDYQMLLLNSGFYELESTILKVTNGLGISAFGVNSIIGNLSGGQRAKVILAKLLLQNPDVLLLDEPTNFLDKQHIEWLTDYLKSFKGAFIVISHDFEFLDKITTCICDIEFCKIIKYSGNFLKFIELKGMKKENYVNEYNTQQKLIKKYENYIAKNKVRASTAQMAKSREKQLQKIDKLPPLEKSTKPNFSFNSLPLTPQKTLVVKNLEIGYSYPLLPKISFEIAFGEKAVITGFNGIGKSTLLKTLMGKILKISGEYKFADKVKPAYFEQELHWRDIDETPLQIMLNEHPEMSESQIRKFLGKCGIKQKNVLRQIGTLSGGEQTKVKICILMLQQSNFLILDEPTNHLDTDSKEVLKSELISWKGSLILVSHETQFYCKWCDKIINIEKFG